MIINCINVQYQPPVDGHTLDEIEREEEDPQSDESEETQSDTTERDDVS